MKSFIQEYGITIVIAIIIMGLIGTTVIFAGEGRNRIESIYGTVTDSVPKTPTVTVTDVTSEVYGTDGFYNNTKVFKVETDSDGEVTASFDTSDLYVFQIVSNEIIYVGNDGFLNSGTATLTVNVGDTKKYIAGTASCEVTYPCAMVTSSMTSSEPKTAVYHLHWKIPDGSQINFARVYRGSTPSATSKLVTFELLMEKGRIYEITEFYRNYTFTLHITNLTTGKWQHAIVVVNYTLDGKTYEMYSAPRCAEVM